MSIIMNAKSVTKVRLCLLGILTALLLSMPVSAATVDGHWTGSVDTPMGALPVLARWRLLA